MYEPHHATAKKITGHNILGEPVELVKWIFLLPPVIFRWAWNRK